MGSYTELFSENFAPIAFLGAGAGTAEQNSGYVNLAKYHRVAIVLHVITTGTTLDLDVEIATDADAANVFTFKHITQLVAADDAEIFVVEIRTDELGKPTGASSENYDWLNVEITPSAAAAYSCVVYGFVPRYGPIDSTLWDEIVT